MFSTNFKRPLLLALVVTAGLLAGAGPASADVVTDNNDPEQANSRKPFSIDVGSSEALHGRATSLKSDRNEVAVEGFWLGSNDALGAAIVAADFNYKEAKGFIESQYVPTSVEAIDVWETLHGDFSTFPTNLTQGPPAVPPFLA